MDFSLLDFDYYFIIPTINGEICGEPFISYSIDYNNLPECTIYGIKQLNDFTFKVIEIY